MSDETLVYETNVKTDITYVVTDIGIGESRFYQVVVEDVFGLQSVSNIENTTSLIWLGKHHNDFICSNE